MPPKGWKKKKSNKKPIPKKEITITPWETESPRILKDLEMQVFKDVEPDLPVTEKLTEVIRQLKAVLNSYRHNIETTIIEKGNETTEITVKISFLVR